MEITLKNITFHQQEHNIFTKLNVTLEGPKIIGLMGEKKTQFMMLLDAIYLPVKGAIQIDDEVLTNENLSSFRRKVALVTQEVSDQFFESTVMDEMAFLVKALKYPTNDLAKRMSDALKIVGLDNTYLDKNIKTLSKGEQKLIQLAVALLYNPKVLLLDEPMIYLDYTNKKKLLRLIKKLKEDYHKTIIIASNDSNLLYGLTDEILLLHHQSGAILKNSASFFQDVKLAKRYKVEVPYLVQFTEKARAKKVRLSYHKDIRDIIKDIYKHVDR